MSKKITKNRVLFLESWPKTLAPSLQEQMKKEPGELSNKVNLVRN